MRTSMHCRVFFWIPKKRRPLSLRSAPSQKLRERFLPTYYREDSYFYTLMIKLNNLNKYYDFDGYKLHVIRNISLEISNGEFVAIMGPSGSGKTTLLNIIGCLNTVDHGDYFLNGLPIHNNDQLQLSVIRNREIGFVFQSFNLIPRMDAFHNVELSMIYAGIRAKVRRQRCIEALCQVGLEDRLHHMPRQLSGGQQQRVAIARALVNRPKLLIADEPTGNLDSHTGKEIMYIFQQLNASHTSIVMVTHDVEIASYAHRIIRLRDGIIEHSR